MSRVLLQQGGAGCRRGWTCADVEKYGPNVAQGELALALRRRGTDQIRSDECMSSQRRTQAAGHLDSAWDRVCMTATMLVLDLIFFADLPPEQYAYPAGPQCPAGGDSWKRRCPMTIRK